MKQPTENDSLNRVLTDLYQADIPESFQASWRDAVKREEPSPMKFMPVWLKRAVLPLAAVVVLVTGTLITGMLSPKTTDPRMDVIMEDTAANTETASYKSMSTAADYGVDDFDGCAVDPEAVYAPAPEGGYAMGAANPTQATAEAPDDRKIVRTIDLTIASTEFDADYAAILALTESTGGYAASVSTSEYQVNSRAASFNLRIPSDALDHYLNGLSGIGRMTNRYETTTDFTTAYSDTALRLTTQQNKMTRLTELLAKAETVEDLLAIESEIADTRYEIESLETSLRSIDRQVTYSAVSIYLREQTPADTAGARELSIGERLINSLKASLSWLGDFLENMLVFLIAASPVLVGILIILFLIRVIRKRKQSH